MICKTGNWLLGSTMVVLGLVYLLWDADHVLQGLSDGFIWIMKDGWRLWPLLFVHWGSRILAANRRESRQE